MIEQKVQHAISRKEVSPGNEGKLKRLQNAQLFMKSRNVNE